jgi:hypothetical protein
MRPTEEPLGDPEEAAGEALEEGVFAEKEPA